MAKEEAKKSRRWWFAMLEVVDQPVEGEPYLTKQEVLGVLRTLSCPAGLGVKVVLVIQGKAPPVAKEEDQKAPSRTHWPACNHQAYLLIGLVTTSNLWRSSEAGWLRLWADGYVTPEVLRARLHHQLIDLLGFRPVRTGPRGPYYVPASTPCDFVAYYERPDMPDLRITRRTVQWVADMVHGWRTNEQRTSMEEGK